MKYKIIQKGNLDFSDSEKHSIIKELLETKCTKQQIWQKYTGYEEEHGQLLRWMKKLGYNIGVVTRRPNIVSKSFQVAKKKIKPQKIEDDYEKLQLEKRIADLEKQLKDAELKAVAFSTMVDIAEKEFKIPIRKKLNTKL